MASNTLAPNGLSFARSNISGANTYQANQYAIKAAFASAIGIGDLVKTGTSGNQGYVVPSLLADTTALGVFVSVLPYYDTTLQSISHGLNGSYPASANPPADIGCLVVSDPFATFIAQVSGGPWAASWRGQNINFLTGTNGVPNISGRSVLALDAATIATTATLPFRILGLAGVSGGPQDPANTNPWIEVRLNTSELLAATGI